ncbi:MAG: gliding motility-associated C-terminal domain-containing protein [Bacteroidetes bacterium]|nr:MAG: gliding motility-associated C-terminal domain-containing protein [Bacteroidota bacterium]
MPGRSDRYIRILVLSLLILSGLAVSLFSQDKQISGKINVYRHVVAIGPGLDNVTLNSVDSIAPGDTVLLIQMQGVGIVTDQNAYGGGVQSKYGEPGGYEFLLVQSVNTGTKIVVFKNNILNTFDAKGSVQLVRVPFYNTATVTGLLTAKSWDPNSKTGGVLVMIVGRKLKLNADIDVSGKGFNGGKDTVGTGVCVEVNPARYNHDSYPKDSLNAGYKGEGLAIHDQFGTLLWPLHAKGQGINFTGGGGGNGKYSGGGGGSNRGFGGDGTTEKNFGAGKCTIQYSGAYGGTTVISTVIANGIFFGGGGGSSTHAAGSTGSSGANGGGIVIMIADTISGNGKLIKASGATALNALSDGGAGGGGSGGSIALSSQSFSNVTDLLTLSVNGGNGGVNPAGFGDGGGGGAGLIWVSKTAIPANVSTNILYGSPGPLNPSDGNGQIKFSFSPTLNGFLFNSIRSEVTGNQIDSICSNVVFGKITGTLPVGGVAPHTYLWESSTTSESAGWGPAAGINDGKDYLPGLLTQTTWFRRKVTDSGAPVLLDISKPVKIIVQPFIKNNIVGNSDTICFAQDPPAFTSKATLTDGNGKYSFKWQVSLNNALYNLPANTYITEGYTPPPALTFTSWYRRTVTSGRCVDSTAIVKITVLDTISKNVILTLPQDICFGMTFTDLSATTPATSPALAGGDNSYRFKWESNINGAGWGVAPGVSNASDYNPIELPQRVPVNEYYFRRVVYSGMHDVCVSTSTPVLLRDYPVITNNSVTANQTICSGFPPAKLIGSVPLNGNGIYTYSWQDSTKIHTWTDISGAIGSDYQPPVLTDTTRYRRIVFSSACSDISNQVIIKVHKPITNFTILPFASGADTTICNGQIPHKLKGNAASGGTNIPGDYAYLWLDSIAGTAWTAVTGAGTGINYQPPALINTTYYKRKVISGSCTETSNMITVNVLPLITNNVISAASPKVCYNTVPAQLTGAALAGGDGTYTYYWEQSTDGGTTWTPASGTTNTSTGSHQLPALLVDTQYRRTVKSGSSDCCSDISTPIIIGINQLPAVAITNLADTTICGGSTVSLKVHLTGATPWKVTYKENTVDGPENTIAAADASIAVIPLSPADLNTYTYSIGKVVDNNGCLATSISGTKKANIYKQPISNAGPDNTVCGPIVNLLAVPSLAAGTGTWYENSLLLGTTSSLMVTIDYTFTGKDTTHTFRWEEVNWQCKSKDSVTVTFDKEEIANAGRDTALFSFDNTIHMVAVNPLIGAGSWTLISGTGTFTPGDESKSNAMVTDLSKGLNTFKWTVQNDKCISEDLINVTVFDLIVPEGFSPNNDNWNNTFIITGLDSLNQDAEMKIISGAGTEVYSTSNLNGGHWEDWDGKNSNGIDLPEGTYYYLLKISSKNVPGQVYKKSGFIILKRY